MRAPITELAKAIAFDSPHAICWPNVGRMCVWYGAQVHVGTAPMRSYASICRAAFAAHSGDDRPVLPAALVDAADVEAGRHRDARAERREPLRELERRVAEVDRAVDVRLRDVHQRDRAVDVGHPHEDRHRQLRGRPAVAIQHRPIGVGQVQHSS